jgi:hypothetical protein
LSKAVIVEKACDSTKIMYRTKKKKKIRPYPHLKQKQKKKKKKKKKKKNGYRKQAPKTL